MKPSPPVTRIFITIQIFIVLVINGIYFKIINLIIIYYKIRIFYILIYTTTNFFILLNEFEEIKLEQHDTKDITDSHVNGILTILWRDWDQIITHTPRMIYVSSVNKNEIKGPHIHLKRHSYFSCIHGKVVFIIKKNNGKYIEIISDSKNPNLIHVPPGIATAHINIANHESKILVFTDLAWRPNDNEMKNISFKNYNWEKWSKYKKIKSDRILDKTISVK